eukprot:SAG11_NODE_1176_length_5600_cov_8.953827_1_plen_123_part_00
MEFTDSSIIKFLSQEKYNHAPDRLNGMDALKDLSYLANLKCLSFLHYNGEVVNKWVKNNPDRFGGVIDEEDYENLSYNAYVYVNHFYQKDWEENMNDYLYHKGEGVEDKYGDNLNWFWAREF